MKLSEKATIAALAFIIATGSGSLLLSERSRSFADATWRGRRAALPDSAFRVRWVRQNVPAIWKQGQATCIRVTLKNTGTTSWPDLASSSPDASGADAVRMSYRWNLPGLNPKADPTPRIDLDGPLLPGASTTLSAEITAPSKAGDYLLEFQLVQELVAWFRQKGAPPLEIAVKVVD